MTQSNFRLLFGLWPAVTRQTSRERRSSGREGFDSKPNPPQHAERQNHEIHWLELQTVLMAPAWAEPFDQGEEPRHNF